MAVPSADRDATPMPGDVGERGRRRRFLILHNTRAGRTRLGLVDEVIARLAREGAVVDLLRRTGGEGGDLAGARSAGYDAIVASGGDGTMRHVLADLSDADVPLALIPAGTGNVLAAELGLPRKAEGIARMLLDGSVARISAASVNGAPFLLMCGVGFDGEIVSRAPEHLKRHLGQLAFCWPTMRALATPPRLFEVMIEGRVHEASWLIVANASRYAGRFVLTRATDVRTPGFSVALSRALGRHQRIAEMMALAAGRLDRCPTIEIIPARTVELRATAALPVQIDGDAFTAPSIRLEAAVSSVPILVP